MSSAVPNRTARRPGPVGRAFRAIPLYSGRHEVVIRHPTFVPQRTFPPFSWLLFVAVESKEGSTGMGFMIFLEIIGIAIGVLGLIIAVVSWSGQKRIKQRR